MTNFSVVAANSQFSIDLYQAVVSGNPKEKNVFFSPFTITAALAMVNVGAHGETRDEILSGIRLKEQSSNTIEQINYEFKQLFQRLNSLGEHNETYGSPSRRKHTDPWPYSPGEPRLDLASRVFLQKGIQVKKHFASTLKSSYNTTFGEVDIAGNSDNAEREINDWVANVTDDKIKDLITGIKSDSKIVLVSVSYFKAGWINKLENDCYKESFYVAGGMVVFTNFMHFWCISDASYAVFPDWNATAIGINYAGSSFRTIIVLPNEKDGIRTLQNLLNPTMFDVSRYQANVSIDLHLPLVSIEADYQISKLLETLGVKKAFLDTANFTGIADSPRLKIEDVFHKSFMSKSTMMVISNYI